MYTNKSNRRYELLWIFFICPKCKKTNKFCYSWIYLQCGFNYNNPIYVKCCDFSKTIIVDKLKYCLEDNIKYSDFKYIYRRNKAVRKIYKFNLLCEYYKENYNIHFINITSSQHNVSKNVKSEYSLFLRNCLFIVFFVSFFLHY